jgi:APA family basic amino acid/polyamine antiporter
VASAALPPTDGKFVEAPILGIADAFDQAWIREPAKYLVAISALVILISAAQAAMLGLSRLGYALAVNRQIPSKMGSLSRTRATPVGIIGFGAVMAICLLIPADLEFLAAICAFGATIAFTIVGASVVWLRYKEPDRDRPYRMPLNVRFRGGSLPIPAVLCVAMSSIAFLSLLIEHGSARWVGVIWMAAGISLYVGYRTSQGKPLLKRVTVPEASLTHRAAEAEFGSMLVPILGTPLDDDIMQTAGRLASEENADDGEGGAVIEALWIFEVPMALPLDTRVPDPELKRARAALNRAKAVGEEYQGVEVATAVVRARRAGQAIVREAKRRGVEAIVLAAEEPTRVGGGLRLGGKPGLHDTSVGETTRYVVNKAPCRVILTAPPAKRALDPMGPVPSEPPLPLGHALGVSEVDGSR